MFFYLSSTYDCGISTVVDSDTISSLPPDLVEISFLDVNELGISINWNDLLNDINDHGYVIYRSTPSGVNPIATVYNVNEKKTVFGHFCPLMTVVGKNKSLPCARNCALTNFLFLKVEKS